MKLLEALRGLVERLQVAHMRRTVLRRKLDDLTDPSFLDRALAGENEMQ